MNLADSERMAGVLEAVGYDCTEDPGDADVLVYNTCSIREKAEVKVYSALGRQVGTWGQWRHTGRWVRGACVRWGLEECRGG